MAQVTLSVEADVATSGTGIAAGAGNHLPVGDYGGQDYRSAMRFPIPAGWTAWTAITKATLTFYISDHQHVAPKNSSIYCSRMPVTGMWTKGAGSQSCESGFSGSNTTQYDDIQSGATDRISFNSGSTANAPKSLDVTAMARAYWGANVKPVFVFDNNGAGEYTEIWADEKSGYNATLVIDYEVQSPPTAPTPTAPSAGAVSQTDTPTFSWTHNDPQGNAQTEATVRVWDAAGTTQVGIGRVVAGVGNSLVWPVALPRGTTYQWDVATSDSSGYGPYSAKQSFSVKANPVVNTDPRKMVFDNGAPRLVATWTTDQPQGQYRVTAPGTPAYDSGWLLGGDQSHTLATLDLTNGTAVPVTIEVRNTDTPYLAGSATRSFTPRWGLTTHKKTLGAVPANWQSPVVSSDVPAGSSLVIEYGSAASAGAGAPTAWYSSIASVPKTQFLWYRVWFIPSATLSPTLHSINIPYDSTVAVLDKWGANPVWPWEANGGIPARFSIDTGEAVYGTRSLRCDVTGNHYINSTLLKVRAGRSYVLSGLMRSQGASGAHFRLIAAGAAPASSPQMLTPGVLTDWARYKTPVWVAPTDMDVYVQCVCESGVAGSTAWWDGIKLEESIVATPWNPATVGATTVDAGGVQVDATKGGLLRYKGTAGGVRDVVEGGANGLLFGGDTPLSSPGLGTLRPGIRGSFVSTGAWQGDGNGGSNGYWGKMGHGVIPDQYHETSFIASLDFIVDGQNDWKHSIVAVKVRQQTAFGTQPTVIIETDGTFPAANVAISVTSVAGPTTFELWVKTPYEWGSASLAILHQADVGAAVFVPDTGLVLTGTALPPGFLYYGKQSGTGTSFPARPSVGERFWRTDLKTEFFFDVSGRFLSTTLFEWQVPLRDIATTSGLTATTGVTHRGSVPDRHGNSDIWVEQAQVSFYILGGTALSASHSWYVQLTKANAAAGQTILQDQTINSGTLNEYRSLVWPINALLYPGAPVVFIMNATKTGTPGNLILMNPVISYRLVA